MTDEDKKPTLQEMLSIIQDKIVIIRKSRFKEENANVVIFDFDEFISFVDLLISSNNEKPIIAFGNISTVGEIVHLWTKEVPSLVGEWLEEEEGIDPEVTMADPELEHKIDELREKILEKVKDKMDEIVLIDLRVPFNGVLIGIKHMNEEEDENLREVLFETADQEFSEFLPALVQEFLTQEISKIKSDVSKIAQEKRVGMSDAFIIYSEEYGLSKAVKIIKRGQEIPHDSKILPKLKRIYSQVVYRDREHVI